MSILIFILRIGINNHTLKIFQQNIFKGVLTSLVIAFVSKTFSEKLWQCLIEKKSVLVCQFKLGKFD